MVVKYVRPCAADKGLSVNQFFCLYFNAILSILQRKKFVDGQWKDEKSAKKHPTTSSDDSLEFIITIYYL